MGEQVAASRPDISNDQCLKTPTPNELKRYLVVTIVSSVLIIFLIAVSYYSFWQTEHLFARHRKILELVSKTELLDEALTMSANMAVATDDEKWQQRYFSLEPTLNSAFVDLETIAAVPTAAKASVANVKLVDMEKRSFLALQRGQKAMARAILQSAEYEQQKKIYSESILSLRRHADAFIQEELTSTRRYVFSLLTVVSLMLVAAVYSWLRVFIYFRAWSIEKIQQLIQSSKFRALGEMSASITHEINNPLAVILGNVGIIKMRIRTGNFQMEDLKAELTKIETTADRIVKIVKGLQVFSRKSEQDPMQMASLASIIEDTLVICGTRFARESVELRIAQIPELQMECRPGQVVQVLLNLLNNACDAVAGLSEKWVELKVISLDGFIKISVIDSGNEIPGDVLQKLMTPFFTTKAAGKGTGLGLSLSRALVESHGGTFQYEPTNGHTSFTLMLPEKQGAGADVSKVIA